MPSRLSDRLLAAGAVSADALGAALARQAVYGGALDTALLEMKALDEPRVWAELAAATGLPVPEPALYERPGKYAGDPGAAVPLDAAWSARCRAVPVGVHHGALHVLCGEPIARAELDAASRALGRPFALYVAPELRLAAARLAVFEQPMSARLVRLLAAVVGAPVVRSWQAAYAPAVAVVEPPPVEIPPPVPARAPAGAVTQPREVAPPDPPPARAVPAPAAPSPPDIPKLIARLRAGGSGFEAAHATLVAITKRDLGSRPKRWETWWAKHRDDDRVDWLFEGLSDKAPEIRASAEAELRALTGVYFGYHFDLPKREREQARERWQAHWLEAGRARPRG